MSKNKKPVGLKLCPACFAKEIDFFLNYDEEDEEYYCRKCCYSGKEEDLERFYKVFTKEKYKEMKVPYPED
jgi:hypothetical protein